MRKALYNITELLHSHYDIPDSTMGVRCLRYRLNRLPSRLRNFSADIYITDGK